MPTIDEALTIGYERHCAGELDIAEGIYGGDHDELGFVITSDTSVAHLAGALGVSVWGALPFVPDWRWLLDRRDSPWYPTMRLFRQKSIGDWGGVFEEIKAALAERLEGDAAAWR